MEEFALCCCAAPVCRFIWTLMSGKWRSSTGHPSMSWRCSHPSLLDPPTPNLCAVQPLNLHRAAFWTRNHHCMLTLVLNSQALAR